MEEDTHSFIINIPNARKMAKPSEACLSLRRAKLTSHRKPSNLSLNKYSLPGSKPLQMKMLQNEDLLLPCRLFSKRQEMERHKTKLKINVYDEYKLTSTDMRMRLHTDSPADDVRALKDIDPKFFQCVNRKTTKTGIPLYKSLRPLTNNLFMVRLRISLNNDCIFRLEVNMRKELETYETSLLRCKDHAQYFDAFISEDYRKTMIILKKWEDLNTKLNLQIAELQSVANDEFFIMSRLIGLDYKYSVQQKYGRLLYYLSPPTWRANNREFARSIEIEKMGFDLGYSGDADPFTVIFDKLKKECCDYKVSPVLYFQQPEDLMNLFESMEKQQQHYLTYVTCLSPYLTTLTQKLVTLKSLIEQSSHAVVTAIKEFENILERENLRCNVIKAKFYKILNGVFYESVGSEEVLKMKLDLQYCYEKVIGEKPMNMGLRSTALVLESRYMYYWNRFDNTHSDHIKKAVQHYLELERRTTKNATIATRELRLFKRLEDKLKISCAPYKRGAAILTPTEPKLKLNAQKRTRMQSRATREISQAKVSNRRKGSLTEAEREYLTLFTDWTENEDPFNYLHVLEMTRDLTE